MRKNNISFAVLFRVKFSPWSNQIQSRIIIAAFDCKLKTRKQPNKQQTQQHTNPAIVLNTKSLQYSHTSTTTSIIGTAAKWRSQILHLLSKQEGTIAVLDQQEQAWRIPKILHLLSKQEGTIAVLDQQVKQERTKDDDSRRRKTMMSTITSAIIIIMIIIISSPTIVMRLYRFQFHPWFLLIGYCERHR